MAGRQEWSRVQTMALVATVVLLLLGPRQGRQRGQSRLDTEQREKFTLYGCVELIYFVFGFICVSVQV